MSENWDSLSEEERINKMVQMKLREERSTPFSKWTRFLQGIVITTIMGGLTLLLFYGIILLLKAILSALGVI